MDWFNVLIYGVIPVLTVVIIFFTKRKLLWVAPLISTAIAFITYMIAFSSSGTSILKIFSNNEWRGFFLLALLFHLVIAVVLTLVAYFAAYRLKRKQK